MQTERSGGGGARNVDLLRNTTCIVRMLLWVADELYEELHDIASADRLLQFAQELALKHGIDIDELRVDCRHPTRN